jgi:hypothetical protein
MFDNFGMASLDPQVVIAIEYFHIGHVLVPEI